MSSFSRFSVDWFLEKGSEDGKKLDLTGINLSFEGARALAGALEKVPTLQGLYIGYNNIGDEMGSALAGALVKVPTLQRLDLAGNHIVVEGARALAGALEKVPTLQQLYLRYNNIGFEGARALAGALEKVPILQQLDLGYNSIGVEGARALAGALEKVPTLQQLNLWSNSIGDEGTRALAGALEKVPTLQRLNLRLNNIGVGGACALAGAVEKVPTLKVLDLGFNNIGDQGAQELAGALEKVPTLQVLHLSGNKIGVKGAQALAGVLEKVPTLQMFDLGLSKKTEETLLQWLGGEDGVDVARTFALGFSLDNRQRAEVVLDAALNRHKALDVLGGSSVPASNVRVLLVGDAEVGKTTFRCSLLRKEGPQPWSRTRGIEVELIEDQGLQIALWDLGGQEEFRVLHSGLMKDESTSASSTSLFVVMLKVERGARAVIDQLKQWLRLINSTGLKGQTRNVAILLNHFPGALPNLNAEFLGDIVKEWSGKDSEVDIGRVLVVTATDSSSVGGVWEDLAGVARDMVGKVKLPVVVYEVRQRLPDWAKDIPFPLMSWRKFCENVVSLPGLGLDALQGMAEEQVQKKVKAVAFLLADTGTIVVLKELQDCVVLDPTWLCHTVLGELLGMRLSAEGLHERSGAVGPPEGFAQTGRGDAVDLELWLGNVVEGRKQEVEPAADNDLGKVDGAWLLKLVLALGLGFRPVDCPDEVIIPSLLPEGGDDILERWRVEPGGDWAVEGERWGVGRRVTCVDKQKALLGLSVFQKLQARLGERAAGCDTVEVAAGVMLQFRGEGSFLLQCDDEHIDILARPANPHPEGLPRPELRKVIVHELRQLTQEVINVCANLRNNVAVERLILGPWHLEDALGGPLRERVAQRVEELVQGVKRRAEPVWCKDSHKRTRRKRLSAPLNHLVEQGELPVDVAAVHGEGREGPKFDVFISHRGPDIKVAAEALRTEMVGGGLPTFVDFRDMRPGARGQEEIVTALWHTDVVVIILSPGFWSSPYCAAEAYAACLKGPFAVFPIFHDVSPGDVATDAESALTLWTRDDLARWWQCLDVVNRVSGGKAGVSMGGQGESSSHWLATSAWESYLKGTAQAIGDTAGMVSTKLDLETAQKQVDWRLKIIRNVKQVIEDRRAWQLQQEREASRGVH